MNAPLPPEVLDRSSYFGSSDISGILGLSRYATPLDIYRRKVEPESFPEHDDDKRKILRRGTLLEPVIRSMAVEDYGLTLCGTGNRYADPEHEFMRAEIDFETIDEAGGLGGIVNNECKSVSPFLADQWGEEDSADIPADYFAQVQFALMVTGRPLAYVWALFGADKLVRYTIPREPDDVIDGIRARAAHFWNAHVLARVPPAPVTIDDVEFLMRRLQGREVVATPDIEDAIQRYRNAKAVAKGAEDEIEELKFTIVEAMRRGAEEQYGKPLLPDEHACLVDLSGKQLCTWKAQTAQRIDVKGLRAAKPEIATQFTTTSVSRVLRLGKA